MNVWFNQMHNQFNQTNTVTLRHLWLESLLTSESICSHQRESTPKGSHWQQPNTFLSQLFLVLHILYSKVMLWKNKNSGADFAYFTSMPKLVIHEVELYNLSKNLSLIWKIYLTCRPLKVGLKAKKSMIILANWKH